MNTRNKKLKLQHSGNKFLLNINLTNGFESYKLDEDGHQSGKETIDHTATTDSNSETESGELLASQARNSG